MARARNIKPGFFKNELLVEMSAFDRLLFIGLWCLADREGRVEDRPKRIKMELFPCDTYDVESGLVGLGKCGFITRYYAGDKNVIAIANFLKHQTPHGTEKDSELPDENGDLTVNNRDQRGYVSGKKRGINVKNIDISKVLTVNPPLDTGVLTVNPLLHNALNPDSLNPDSLIQYSEAKASGAKPPKITDPSEIIFGYGVPMLVNAGTAEKQARSFLGGLRKHHGDDALICKLRECIKAKPLEPMAWLAGALPPKGAPPRVQQETFAERDERNARERFETAVGRSKQATVVDMEFLEIEK